MLKIAYAYKDELQKLWMDVVHTEKYKYYNSSNFWNYNLNIQDSSWDSISMVSVDKNNKILGNITAYVDRTSNKISSICALNFGEISYTFSKDFCTFLDSLFTKYSFRKIEWGVAIGNPAEKMYDKIVKKYGGRVIGISIQSIMLENGEYCDLKSYEIFKDDYFKNKNPTKG